MSNAQPLGDAVAEAARLVLRAWPDDKEKLDPRELLDRLSNRGFHQRVLALAILDLLKRKSLELTDERFLARSRSLRDDSRVASA